MLSSWRFALLIASLGLSALLPTTASANGALLRRSADVAPASVGMRIAIATTASGTTRWSDVNLPADAPVGWLVPVRPGAVVDWAPGPWLDALDQATAPRILGPSSPGWCPTRLSHEVPPRWTPARARQAPTPFSIQATADSARDWATTHGFLISAAQASRVDELYASGWQTVAIELAASDDGRMSATLRVTDDGGPVLPLALTGQPNDANDTPLTVFVIGAGVAGITGVDGVAKTRDLDRLEVLWGPSGSTYATYRDEIVSGGSGAVWLRESASHEALFADVPRTGMPAIRSVVTGYFDDPDCAARVGDVGARADVVEPGELTCGERTDLAHALAGTAPGDAFVTRLVGVQPGGKLGRNATVDVRPATTRPVAIRAGGYMACDPSQGAPPPTYDPPRYDPPSYPDPVGSPPSPSRSPALDDSSSSTTTGTIYVPSDGCGGGTVVTSDDSSDTDTDTGWDSSDSSDSCSSDTSTSDGWDSSDSSDSCSSDTSTSDGWDSSDSSTCSTARAPKRRGPSPLSRLALLAAALLLPLRRRLRPLSGDRS